MHDIRLIRDNPETFDQGLARRGLPPKSQAVLDLDSRRRAVQTEFQAAQAKRNDLSRQVGEAKKSGKDAADLMVQVATLKTTLETLEQQEKTLAEELETMLAVIPNLPAADVPEGRDETGNVEIRRHGTPVTIAAPKDHEALGTALGQVDFDAAAKMSGARFVVLRDDIARLHRALGNFMLDIHTREFGYTEVSPPLLVKSEAVYGTGQLPKAAEDMFQTTGGYWLIPTSEVSLTNLVADSILEAADLPLRCTALTPCFRSEAGAAGKDTRGMIRQHQFWKVELVSVTAPDQSEAEHERMTGAAEAILKRLELPFRTMLLCTGDMGFSARKTYDLEVWLPAQNTYREISSCSNCGDFQARRMKARYRPAAGEKGTQLVHTLNGSGLAVGRCLVAVMENFQNPDGSITIPPALRPYMGGQERIGR
ncbi:MAG: serine--tRNA ligase [Pseudomonadota bacterium]|nr:serine--tRNA ligase [Pseudomonadota bacterium]